MTRATAAGLITFFGVAFGIPWFGWLVIRNDDLSLWLFPMFASLGGFAAAFAEGGVPALRAFCGRVFAVSTAWRYVPAAILIPPLLGLSYYWQTASSFPPKLCPSDRSSASHLAQP